MGPTPPDDRLFRTVFEDTLDAILLTDDEGTYVDANGAATELFGCSREEFVDRSIAEFAAQDFDFEAVWETFLEDGEMRGEFEVHRPDGKVRTAEFAASANVLPGIHLSALRDVTEVAGDRIELSRKTEMLSKVFETSPVGIVVIDSEGAIVEANHQSEAVLGLDRDEITDRTYDDPRWAVVDGDGDPISAEKLPVATVLETCEPVFDFEHGIEKSGDETAWLSVNAAPIYDGDGCLSQVVAVVSDVTEQYEYRRLLEQQNERLEAYSSTVSHDLRSPLSVASGWLDVAMEDDSTEHLGKVREALDRMGQLITDLRALGRYGQTVEGMTQFDLETVVTEAWSNVDTDGATIEIDPGLGTINGERGRLLQLFENLFRNSVEHGSTAERSPEESVVTVRIGPLERGFYVEDDGPGIPEDEREDVFAFGYSTAESGTGIGLAIVEAIVDAHGWELTLDESEPHGARFEFRPRWHPDRRGE